jgi:hypothetical protein
MLGCIDCKDARSTCGTTLSSACVWYTGQLPKFINKSDVTCKVNINDIFKLYGDKIDAIIEDTNIKNLSPRCLGYDTSDITHSKLEDIQNQNICELKSTVSELSTLIDNFDIGNQEITIDLKCLKPNGLACQTAPDTYTLKSILNIIISKLCP